VELYCRVNETLAEIWAFTDAELTTNLQFGSASNRCKLGYDQLGACTCIRIPNKMRNTARHGIFQSHGPKEPTASKALRTKHDPNGPTISGRDDGLSPSRTRRDDNLIREQWDFTRRRLRQPFAPYDRFSFQANQTCDLFGKQASLRTPCTSAASSTATIPRATRATPLAAARPPCLAHELKLAAKLLSELLNGPPPFTGISRLSKLRAKDFRSSMQ
jgi:hypothetical protein